MTLAGGCYCGELRYEVEGPPLFKGQCHCRECQHIAGGAPNLFMTLSAKGFAYTQGAPKTFSRTDLDAPVVREFCGTCGTHLLTRTPRYPAVVVLKIGTLDDPAAFGGPQVAIWTSEAQPFHVIPEGMQTAPGFPGG